jgi:hypothetical protein
VEEGIFEEQVRHLAENHYRTLTGGEFHEVLTGMRRAEENTVVLTFDDGRESLWSVAYPLLEKYGLSAIGFIVSSRVPDTEECHPNLDDVREGKATQGDLEERRRKTPLCTWGEIRRMQESGLIDFQSHTSHHNSVYVSDRLVEFINPSFQASTLRGTLCPVVRKNGQDEFPERLEWGTPVYEWAPAMSAERRYHEDENLTRECVAFVEENGGPSFFDRFGWRRMLRNYVDGYLQKNGRAGRFERPEERYRGMYRDLAESKTVIEERLGKPVLHLCYPWYEGCGTAVDAPREAGYLCNHWGILDYPAVNRVGGDPYRITRINDEYLFALPGRGRRCLWEILGNKIEWLRNGKGR